jgi:hypothetical protein
MSCRVVTPAFPPRMRGGVHYYAEKCSNKRL